MNGIGFFSDSIHSISSVFTTLEFFFFYHSSFPSFSLFIFPLLSHPFIVISLLLGTTRSFILFFQIPMNELNEFSRIEASLLFTIGVFKFVEEFSSFILELLNSLELILLKLSKPN